MPKGHALLVGLRRVDPQAYSGWNGENGCYGCELDVDNVVRILAPLNYGIKTLKTGEATKGRITGELARIAETSQGGDSVVFYYSGHGGQQPDQDGDESDGKDETLVAYDGELIDDAVHEALKKFKKDVRLIMLSDSCNSGTNYRAMRKPITVKTPFKPIGDKRKRDVSINAQLIHLGGCRDGGTSNGYQGGGAFTIALCNHWNGGSFKGSMNDLYGKVVATLKAQGEEQKPAYNEYGPVTESFKKQQAFSI